MPAPHTDERWFVSLLSDPGAKLRVLAGKPIGANRLVKEFDTPEEAEAAVREHNDRLNEKGPASAATDPDHGSTIPGEETAMNRPNDATRPVDPAMPRSFEKAFLDLEGLVLDLRGLTRLHGVLLDGVFGDSRSKSLGEDQIDAICRSAGLVEAKSKELDALYLAYFNADGAPVEEAA